MTGRRVRFTDETAFELPAPFDVEEVHLSDLSFVLDVETDGDLVTACTIDMEELVRAMILFSSMEHHRHSWRRQ